MQKYLLLAISIFIQILTLAQPSSSEIIWSSEKKLTWSDFKGEPDQDIISSGHTKALSSVGFAYGFSGDNYEVNYWLICSFWPEKSWTISEDEYLLAHEQLHFDIAEWHARLIRKQLEKAIQNGEKSFKKLSGIVESIKKEHQLMQEKYDNETRHSMNKEAQMNWNKKVAEKLAHVSAYSSDQIKYQIPDK